MGSCQLQVQRHHFVSLQLTVVKVFTPYSSSFCQWVLSPPSNKTTSLHPKKEIHTMEINIC